MTEADRPQRLLVIGDTDSYVKWGAALASRLPTGWAPDLVVIRNPMQPSDRQLESALAGTAFVSASVRIVDLDDLGPLVRAERPHAVLLSVRGPMVRVLVRLVVSRHWRPVIVSGLPGITIPSNPKAVVYREQADLVVLHSRREVREFTAIAEGLGVSTRFGLATFPFLADSAARDDGRRRDAVVFAAQAKVPAGKQDRILLLSWLVRLAQRRPDRRIVIKVRARAGEAQTHPERWDYAGLLDEPELLELVGGAVPENVVVADGPMAEHLDHAVALVTVSSTAALEAVAAGVPILLPSDFGVSAKLINVVFEGSGLFGDAEDLMAGRFSAPSGSWRGDNYLHGRAEDDWVGALDALVAREREAPSRVLPQRFNRVGWGLRRSWERKRMLGDVDRTVSGRIAVLVAVPARRVVRAARRVRRLARA
ncbi:hypothetical protein CLV49_2237 [Labedella gwakjiensis]|uniref:Glycosyltransferase involved in cell wall biosynthesis n=1 Tax=Labedella gwakjiensis TaxID=390269 RepID=A0A2P8GXC5_9MICO|nr:DUF6716 putative glycosyltransferase [Labedella gwakjiensis]PSL38612.1 hypothetical protein CLV49_2237 [Labedella gwakjiensis]RUQ86884.1 hypothetical protein ELQ93_08035 [Labedella gwakjiensis]